MLSALRRRPLLLDGLVALVLCLLVVQEALWSGITTPRGLAVVVALLMTLPLAARRRHPVPVALVVAAAWGALGVLDESELPPQTTLLALGVTAWSVGAYAAKRPALFGLGICFAGLLVNEAEDFIVLGPLMGGAWAVGRLFRDRHRWAAELEERGARLERERAEQTRLAVVEERARIARELHDVVAHHVSVMVMQAGAERLALEGDRPRSAEALSSIESTGREAMAEMRRLLDMLREDDAELALAPQPSLDRIEGLVEHVRAAGLPVTLEIRGRRRAVPPGVDISGYRIVQEALTNALRHAGPARARVVLTYSDDSIEIDVRDDGLGAAADAGDPGHGLAGMRERAAVFGGRLEAGPAAGGGYRVRTRLPLGGASA